MRSDNVTKGSERAPNRSLFYALGYTKEELERPLIGVVSAYSEIVPGHMNLDKIADAVKAGVEMAGGTPPRPFASVLFQGFLVSDLNGLLSMPSADPAGRRRYQRCRSGLFRSQLQTEPVPGC